MKVCSKCKVEKDESEFHNDKQNKDGKSGRCKVCAINAAHAHYANNHEKSLIIRRMYRATIGKEVLSEKNKEYRAKNTEKLKDKKHLYYENNKETILKKSNEYRCLNKVKISISKKQWAEKNKARLIANGKEYRTKNNESIRRRMKLLFSKKVEAISDDYVVRIFNQRLIVAPKEYPQELIDFHREVIRAKRLLKELQK